MAQSLTIAEIKISSDKATQFVLDVNAHYFLETVVGFEPERQGALGIEIARPTRDNFLDKGVGFAPDARDDLVAADFAQRGDLLADGDC